MRYVYPAKIYYQDGVHYVEFPELEGCFTDGKTLFEALENAEDALNLYLWTCEYDGLEIPSPRYIDFNLLIKADTETYTEVVKRENPEMEIDETRIKKEIQKAG